MPVQNFNSKGFDLRNIRLYAQRYRMKNGGGMRCF